MYLLEIKKYVYVNPVQVFNTLEPCRPKVAQLSIFNNHFTISEKVDRYIAILNNVSHKMG